MRREEYILTVHSFCIEMTTQIEDEPLNETQICRTAPKTFLEPVLQITECCSGKRFLRTTDAAECNRVRQLRKPQGKTFSTSPSRAFRWNATSETFSIFSKGRFLLHEAFPPCFRGYTWEEDVASLSLSSYGFFRSSRSGIRLSKLTAEIRRVLDRFFLFLGLLCDRPLIPLICNDGGGNGVVEIRETKQDP